MFRHVAIVGLGLIGGSVGLAIRAAHAAKEVWGFDMNGASCERARELGAIDHVAPTLAAAVHNADFVVLATPVCTMYQALQELAPALSQDTIVTDVASTKAQVVSWAETFLPAHVSFVAGHPMAGKESSGIDVAEATLFQNRVYCLTPTQHTHTLAVETVSMFVQDILGARLSVLDPNTHDTLVAAISHVPFLASTTLMNTIAEDGMWNDASTLAASGFRDMTRLAAGSPDMYYDICLTNKTAIVPMLDSYISHLTNVRELIKNEQRAMYNHFVQSRHHRLLWQSTRKE